MSEQEKRPMKFYKNIKNCKKEEPETRFMKNKDGQLVTAEKETIKRWKQYYEHFLKVHNDNSGGDQAQYSAELVIDPLIN